MKTWRKCGKFLVPYQRFAGINEERKVDRLMGFVWNPIVPDQ